MKKFSCALIGLGAIGIGYDYDLKDSYLTHASAITRHPGFELLCGVDISYKRRQLFEVKYNLPAFENIADIMCWPDIDLFIIASPTHLHLDHITEIVKSFSPQAILCDKPISTDYQRAEKLVQHLSALNIDLYLNYIRRCDPSTPVIKRIIKENSADSVVKGYCYYTKGAYNNASHFVNLLEYWLGPCQLSLLSEPTNTHLYNNDFDCDFYARFDNAVIIFQHGESKAYPLLDLRLYLSGGILDYAFGGEYVYYLPKEYIGIEPQPYLAPWATIPTELYKYQLNVYQQVYSALLGLQHNLSTAQDALQTVSSLSTLHQ